RHSLPTRRSSDLRFRYTQGISRYPRENCGRTQRPSSPFWLDGPSVTSSTAFCEATSDFTKIHHLSRLPLTLNLQPHPTTRPLRRQQVIHRSPNTLKQLRREPRSRQILRHHLSDVKGGPPIRRFEEPGLPRLSQRLIPIGRHRMPPRIRLRHFNLADNLHRVSLRLLGLRPMPHPFSSTLTNRTSRTHQRPFPNQSSKPGCHQQRRGYLHTMFHNPTFHGPKT